MLILTRRPNESVDFIDSTGKVICTMTVLALLPNQKVRVGFEADPSLRIVRDDAVQREEMDQDGNSNETDYQDDSRGNR